MHSEDIKKAREAARAYLAEREHAALAGFAEALCGGVGVADFARWLESETAGASFAEIVDALEYLDALGALDTPAGELLTSRLAALQAEDGGWGPATDPLERLATSGRVAGLLAKSPFTPNRSLRGAEEYLTGNWSEARVRAGSLVDIDAYFHWFANHPGELADEALQWCGRELTRGFRSGTIGPAVAGRIFVRCGARALPAAPLSAAEVCEALLAAQREDGGFSEPQIGSDLEATGVALRVLTALG